MDNIKTNQEKIDEIYTIIKRGERNNKIWLVVKVILFIIMIFGYYTVLKSVGSGGLYGGFLGGNTFSGTTMLGSGSSISDLIISNQGAINSLLEK